MAKAVAFLELNLTQFDRAIASAQRQLAVLAGAFVSFKSAQFLASHTKDAIDFANSLWRVSQQMGKMDVGSLLLSQKALEQVGYSAEAARTRIQELVGAGIPLSVAFGGSKNYAEAITRASEQFGGTATILSRSASQFAVTWDKLQSAAGKVREFFLGMSEKFLRPLQVLLDRMIAMDFGGMGERVGAAIASAVNALNGALANNTLGDIISTGFQLGVALLRNAFERGGEIIAEAALAIGVAINAAIVSINWGNLAMTLGASLFKAIYSAMEMGALLLVRTLGSALSLIPGMGDTSVRNDELLAEVSTMFRTAKEGVDETLKSEGGGIISVDANSAVRAAMEQFKMSADSILGTLGETIGESQEIKTLKARLAGLGQAAEETGKTLSKNTPGKPGNIGVGKADPFKVIADSLARVGGGGGFVQTGQTLESKLLIQQLYYQREQLEQQKILVKNSSKGATSLSQQN
jgi:hypothetical protein